MSDKRQSIGQKKPAEGLPDDRPDGDDSLGAVEGERPSDPQPGNANAPGIDDQGRPNDPVRTGQDRIGANLDETEG